ncbi:unnamed protein product [Nesidiocoris tenuis]|uniref:Nucleolar protein 58 n=1 Tax=Nesidiocoris tenuis TaxID=355587 RepID=A0A6H5HUS3_9HEMI|nr:unnamed protein product [Nesidiocoris tenuis]
MRCIRSQAESLLAGLPSKEATAMALGLAHSLSRYKLKFSPDKVDTMIVQAICLLDELDKELNNYTMRCREWYGWHFPELGKILTDNVAFVKVVKLMGTRENAANTDLSDLLPEDVEEKVKEAAEVSMGTEISEDDIDNIQRLCDQVLEMTLYRSQLYDYLKSRMTAIAPNLTVLLGELVGARLISHSGSLINLAKQPASTLQIFGAEKALFRALKTQKDTPKYGLIYHANLVSTASAKNKGKMSRSLAAKASLAARVDALGEGDEAVAELGINHRAKLETRLKILEEGNLRKISGSAKAKAKFEKYQSKNPPKKKKKIKVETPEPVEVKTEGEVGKKKKKKKSMDVQEETNGETFDAHHDHCDPAVKAHSPKVRIGGLVPVPHCERAPASWPRCYSDVTSSSSMIATTINSKSAQCGQNRLCGRRKPSLTVSLSKTLTKLENRGEIRFLLTRSHINSLL